MKLVHHLCSHSLKLFALLMLLGGCGGADNSASSSPAPTLQGVQISLEDSRLVVGLSSRAQAAVLYSDNSLQDVAAQWFSSNTAVASIDADGVISAVAPGSAVISAVVQDRIGSATLTVVQAQLVALEISPANPGIAAGVQQQFSATGRYSNGATNLSYDVTEQVSWSSSDSAVLAISDSAGSKGLATALSGGAATLGVSLDGVSASLPVNVSTSPLTRIEISAPHTTVPAGTRVQLTATGIFADGNEQDLTALVNWNSADSGIASVSAGGLVSALVAGTTTVSLSYQGKAATLGIVVSGAALGRIEISPAHPELAAGETLQLHAIAIYSDDTHLEVTGQATWSTSDSSIARVGNTDLDRGRLSALAIGSATVTAHFGGQSRQAAVNVAAHSLQSLEISPSNPSIALGTQQGFRVVGHYDDGATRDLTAQVSWTSADPSVAEALDDPGYFKGGAAGGTRITAALGGTIAFTDLSVTPATLDSISLSPTDLSIARGYSVRLTATGHFSDASSQDISRSVNWQSDDNMLVSIVNAGADSGLLSALAPGSVTVSAGFAGISQSTTVTVTAATLSSLGIQLADNVMVAGSQQSATATAQFSDASSLDVTAAVVWSSSDDDIAAVSNAAGEQGRVTALAAGQVTLSAALDGIDASQALSVSDAPDAPVSVSLFAAPNVILNDGADSTTITVMLRPAGSGGSIVDNTQIDILITAGASVTQRTLLTSNGRATFTLDSLHSGFITIQATLAGTAIQSSGYILATPSFANVIAALSYQNPQYENSTLVAGSWFALLVKNISNRTFAVDDYRFSNGAVTTTVPGTEISGGQFNGGDLHGLIATLTNDQPDNGVGGVLSLTDTTTAQQFDIEAVFTTP